jgi:hypothetical protein
MRATACVEKTTVGVDNSTQLTGPNILEHATSRDKPALEKDLAELHTITHSSFELDGTTPAFITKNTGVWYNLAWRLVTTKRLRAKS